MTKNLIKTILAVGASLSLLAASAYAKENYTPVAEEIYDGHIYRVYEQALTPPEAQKYCEEMGGYLVSITSKEENEFVNKLAEKANINEYIIGATDINEEGTWEWMSGEEWNYIYWNSPIEPNNGLGRGEDYAAADIKKSWKWTDLYGGYDGYKAKYSFICEMPADVNVLFPTFNITINGVQQNNARREYPFILYRDITYFPMTFDDCLSLGVVNIWNNEERCNRIYAGGLGTVYYPPQTQYSTAFNTAKAQYAPNAVYVNDVKVNNGAETYPILLYKNVLYFPLTWNWITSFGWNYTFDMTNGLSISTIR